MWRQFRTDMNALLELAEKSMAALVVLQNELLLNK